MLHGKKKHITYVDLFAGCGGMSLGLSWAGLQHVLAVERSTMAAETYFHNMIERIGFDGASSWDAFTEQSRGWVARQLRGGVFVGSIEDLLSRHRAELAAVIREKTGEAGLDLVVGGPPCQGFSSAGKRVANDTRNEMPWHFLEFVERFNPRAVVMENVHGFRHGFTKDQQPSVGEVIQQALSSMGQGYVTQALLLNARHYGVPQNRPRVMLVGLRLDVASSLGIPSLPPSWESGIQGAEISPVAPFPVPPNEWTNTRDAFGDLSRDGYSGRSPREGTYAHEMRFAKGVPAAGQGTVSNGSGLSNHVPRCHGNAVVARFQLYQVMRDFRLDKNLLLLGQEESTMRHASWDAVKMIPDSFFPFTITTDPPRVLYRKQLHQLMFDSRTGKHSQKALSWDQPSSTVMTIPDDFVHPGEPRTLTVREMARLQSFPDSFEFRGKVTTGGKARRTDVPQYTQVGNAVPPLLAMHLGMQLKGILARYGK